MSIELTKRNFINKFRIQKDHVAMSMLEESGVVLIDTTKKTHLNKTFSNIWIYKFEDSSRYLITANFQLVYSKAQVLHYVLNQPSEKMPMSQIIEKMNISKDDYEIKRYSNTEKTSNYEFLDIKKPKLFVNKKRQIKIDCSNYVIIT